MSHKRVLTVQDASCVGQCSLTVALPILSACGIEAAVLPSALLSTHTAGFTGFTVLDLTPEFPKILAHWKKEGITFDGVYTGYILESQIGYINEICATLNKGPKIIDPVMADHGAFYYGFDQAFARKMCTLCQGADVILPNLTEAAFLLEEECVLSGYDEQFIEALCQRLSDRLQVKTVVLTGVSFSPDKLGACVYENGKAEYYFTQRVARNFHGTGDIYSSAFVSAYIRGKSALESAAIAADYTVEAMQLTLPCQQEHSYGVFFEQAMPTLLKRLELV